MAVGATSATPADTVRHARLATDIPDCRSLLAARALATRSSISYQSVTEGDDGHSQPSRIRRLSQFDAAHRNRDTWPAPHSPRSFGLCRISASATRSLRSHAG